MWESVCNFVAIKFSNQNNVETVEMEKLCEEEWIHGGEVTVGRRAQFSIKNRRLCNESQLVACRGIATCV